jgi:hypothetical protein
MFIKGRCHDMWPLSAQQGAFSGCGWRNLRICRIGSSGQLTRGGIPAWGLAEVLATPYLKTYNLVKHFTSLRTLTDPLERQRQWKSDVIFQTWNVISLCRLGSLTTVGRELARCRLDVVAVQEVGWDKEGTVRAKD